MKTIIFNYLKHGILIMIMFIGMAPIYAQTLSYEKSLEVVLEDGVNIKLYGATEGNAYFYLPPSRSLKLGHKEDDAKTPEFLFMKFTTEEKEEQGGVQGALLHFLMEWGLTPVQMQDLEKKVKEKTGGSGTVQGPIDLIADEGESFKIISAVLSDKGFTPSFVTSGKAPPLPGSKAAVAARLDKNGAQLLAATFEKSRSITDISLALNYSYTVLIKAAKGKLTYNWELLQNSGEGLAYDYIKKELDGNPQQMQNAIDAFEKNKDKLNQECGVSSAMGDLMVAAQATDNAIGNTSGSGSSGGTWEYHVGESLMRKIYDYLEENEVIKLEWTETIADDRLEVIRNAFFEYFLNAFTDQEYPEPISSDRLAIDAPENSIKADAEGAYSFKGCSQLSSQKTRNKTIILDNIFLPVKRSHQMVANLASTYDMVKSNPKCVTSVNLNDPFFQHRDINFIVDLEAKEMFEKEVNYVTVNVRKKRSSGNDFNDAVTINKDFLEKNGALATLTYARGEDNNSDLYEYKAQWSLKGGNIYPSTPNWKKGDWEGITLSSPVKSRRIEFEASLDELKESDITRATLQLRYYKFGEEVETNIPLTVSKGVPLIEELVFTDIDARGYAYRLVLTHKQEGKLALPWESKVNDDYVYASIPKELQDFESILFKEAKEAGKEMLDVAKEKVLDKFKDLIGGNN